MLGRPLLGAGVRRRAARLATSTLAITAVGTMGGCLTRPIAPLDSRTTSLVVQKLAASPVDKIDLLLVVDNSASMADKQKILGRAIPDLITGLVNPPCLDSAGKAAATQPAGPLDPCGSGSQREFPPVIDIHVGLISSSLGSFGTDGCPEMPTTLVPGGNPTMNDRGHLIARTDPQNPTAEGPTYQNMGFLAWDPGGNLKPPGEPSLGLNGPGLLTNLRAMILGDGQLGCGFESQNEAWYRFLIDPTPYKTITFPDEQVQIADIDTDLLTDRQNFLRPDSLLAIVNVTDETDTSIKQFSGFPAFSELDQMYRARAECAKSPTDPCCASCGSPTPEGCPVDPLCVSKPRYDASEENPLIRAFGLVSHRATYGAEFFYPPSRYVAALTQKTVTDVHGKTVANPIYSVIDPSTGDKTVRDPSLVFYATITGVPWQLIARQKDGEPDLTNGVSSLDATQVGGFKTSSELSVKDASGHTAWDYIVGDPERYVAPLSPFMIERGSPRSGTDPLTGISVSPSSGAGDNPINGHERTIAQPPGDIEYACIFPVLEPINCADPTVTSCDCDKDASPDNPLCGPNPMDLDPITQQPRRTQQIAAKAYPGIKNLAIAKGMGDQGIAASICAEQLSTDAPNYGYRPAMTAIIDRLKSVIGGECLPRQLFPAADGQVPCVVLEANPAGSPACACDGVARQPVEASHQHAIQEVELQDSSTVGDCFCEVSPTQGAAIAACQQDDESGATNGWCYVDETHGDPALVTQCPVSEKQQVHFVGAGRPSKGATDYIICSSDGT